MVGLSVAVTVDVASTSVLEEVVDSVAVAKEAVTRTTLSFSILSRGILALESLLSTAGLSVPDVGKSSEFKTMRLDFPAADFGDCKRPVADVGEPMEEDVVRVEGIVEVIVDANSTDASFGEERNDGDFKAGEGKLFVETVIV